MSTSRRDWSALRSACCVALVGGTCALLLGASTYVEAQETPSKVYSVVISNNSSEDEDTPTLRYADDDGARYWELFSAISDKTTLLARLDRESRRVFDGLESVSIPPTRASVLKALRDVQDEIRRDRKAGYQTTLFVVFTGHGAVSSSGMGYLSLQDGRITREDLQRELIRPETAHRTHLIIDACNAYYMVQSRNGKGSKRSTLKRDPFEAFLESSRKDAQPPSVGVFLSTAGAAEVHEWSRFQAGVFSHQLRSGLLGAADANGDLQISYQELEAWLAAANASVRHPRAQINVHARGPSRDRDAILVDLRRLQKTTLLEIDPKHAGRYTIEDSRGVRYADFHTSSDATVRLALLWDPLWRAPYYYVRTENREARVAPNSAQEGGLVSVAQLSFAQRADRPRGSVDEAYRNGLFKTPFGPGFMSGYHAALERMSMSKVAPAPVSEPSMEFGARVSWIASPEVFGLDSVAQGVQSTFDFWVLPSWSLQAFGEYRTSAVSADGPEREAFRLHRLAFGVGTAWRVKFNTHLFFELDAKTGHQWVIHNSATQARADALAWRLESGAGFGFHVGSNIELGVRVGPSLDVLTLDGAESLEVLPHGGLLLGTRW